MDDVYVKPNMVIRGVYGMFITFTKVSQVPKAIAFDFLTLSVALDARAYQCRESSSFGIFLGSVRNIDKSSAYATTAVFAFPAMSIPCRSLSSLHISGLRHRVNSIMLSGHPCRTPRQIGMVSEACQLMCICDDALL